MSFLDDLQKSTRSPSEIEEDRQAVKRRETTRIAKSALVYAKRECKKAAHSGKRFASFNMTWDDPRTGVMIDHVYFGPDELETWAATLKQLLLSEGLTDIEYKVHKSVFDVDYRAEFTIKW